MFVFLMATMGANGIFGLKLVIRNAMQNAHFQKLFEAAIYCGPVNLTRKSIFQVGVRKCMAGMQKGLQNGNPLAGMPQIKIAQKVLCCIHFAAKVG